MDQLASRQDRERENFTMRGRRRNLGQRKSKSLHPDELGHSKAKMTTRELSTRATRKTITTTTRRRRRRRSMTNTTHNRRRKPRKSQNPQGTILVTVLALAYALACTLSPAPLITIARLVEAQTPRQSSAPETAAAAGSDQPFVFKHNQEERESNHWLASGRTALESALRWAPNVERAKSAVIFIGDGMSLTTITAARILHGQLANKSGEEDQIAFDQLSNVALIKTYNIDQQVPDSAATATAILTGVKANFYTLGVNGNVRLNDTNCTRVQANEVNSLLKMAQEAGKSTGIVTNTRITHATPAAAYAHVSNRRWECDAQMPRVLDASPCKDIARQLIEDEPGSKLNVIMGGGRRCFFGSDYFDPGPTGHAGMRLDQRNLISQWLANRKANHDRNYAFVNSTKDLRSINPETTDYLLGLFSYSHMSYEELRDTSAYGEPSLTEMTETALKILSKNPLGFVLLVEGGRIDHAHHENIAGVALRETISLSWAVSRARQLVNAADTLLAVTSDHAHALTFNGIAPRGNPILGLSRYKENSTQLPYTTLLYGNGPGNQRGQRTDPRLGPNSTESPYHVQYAAIHQEEAFHDGSDVAIFASGPHAHLFQGTQEQSYIAHVFAYALCVGSYQLAGAHCSGQANRVDLTGSGVGGGGGDFLQSNRIDQSSDASTRAHTFLVSASHNPPALGRGISSGYTRAGAASNQQLDDFYGGQSLSSARAGASSSSAPAYHFIMSHQWLLALTMATASLLLCSCLTNQSDHLARFGGDEVSELGEGCPPARPTGQPLQLPSLFESLSETKPQRRVVA